MIFDHPVKLLPLPTLLNNVCVKSFVTDVADVALTSLNQPVNDPPESILSDVSHNDMDHKPRYR